MNDNDRPSYTEQWIKGFHSPHTIPGSLAEQQGQDVAKSRLEKTNSTGGGFGVLAVLGIALLFIPSVLATISIMIASLAASVVTLPLLAFARRGAEKGASLGSLFWRSALANGAGALGFFWVAFTSIHRAAVPASAIKEPALSEATMTFSHAVAGASVWMIQHLFALLRRRLPGESAYRGPAPEYATTLNQVPPEETSQFVQSIGGTLGWTVALLMIGLPMILYALAIRRYCGIYRAIPLALLNQGALAFASLFMLGLLLFDYSIGIIDGIAE
ncbi:MAG: hypothetical protein KF780_00840 [Sphingomonas sp.]|nr:hypothetical protein [Sphingomonas sp.]